MADSAEPPDSAAQPEFASEMEIIVQPDAFRNFVLLADGGNNVEDVLVEILGSDRAGRAPEPRIFFNDMELQKQNTLADCGIKLGSVLLLQCTPRVLAHTDGGKFSGCILGLSSLLKLYGACLWINQIFRIFYVCLIPAVSIRANRGFSRPDTGASIGFPTRPDGDGELKIYVLSENYGNYALGVENSSTVQDVLTTVLPISRLTARPEPKLYFNGHLLERAKSLADCGIEDGSILYLECTSGRLTSANVRERPNVISNRKKILLIDQPLAIWEKEHDKVLLGLLVEQIRKRGTKILYDEDNFWCDIVAKFNKTTGLKYKCKHLYERFNFYACEYHIVKRIRHHPKFSWDHRRQVVIATDANWNEYIEDNFGARPYRWRAVPYIDSLEIMFANKEES